MNREMRKMRSMILVVALSLPTLMTAACGTLVGTGTGATGEAIYDVTR